MNMSSNRHRFQEVMEKHLGCSDPAKLPTYKAKLEAVIVDAQLSSELLDALKIDAPSTYFKAVLSLVEAIVSIKRGHHSWAIVKLYYSCFYLVRFAFAIRSIGVVRCKKIYTLSSVVNSAPIHRSGKGDHKVLIGAFVSEYSKTEKILSNSIEGVCVFDWLMNKRELVHYRDATFREPDLHYFEKSILTGQISHWITAYLSDTTLVYCFQEEHACLAIPLTFCRELTIEYNNIGFKSIITENQRKVIHSILNESGLLKNEDITNLLLS